MAVIIGAATLQKWRLKMDFERDEIIIDPKVTKLWLLSFPDPEPTNRKVRALEV